jgi:hypothetical protein
MNVQQPPGGIYPTPYGTQNAPSTAPPAPPLKEIGDNVDPINFMVSAISNESGGKPGNLTLTGGFQKVDNTPDSPVEYFHYKNAEERAECYYFKQVWTATFDAPQFDPVTHQQIGMAKKTLTFTTNVYTNIPIQIPKDPNKGAVAKLASIHTKFCTEATLITLNPNYSTSDEYQKIKERKQQIQNQMFIVVQLFSGSKEARLDGKFDLSNLNFARIHFGNIIVQGQQTQKKHHIDIAITTDDVAKQRFALTAEEEAPAQVKESAAVQRGWKAKNIIHEKLDAHEKDIKTMKEEEAQAVKKELLDGAFREASISREDYEKYIEKENAELESKIGTLKYYFTDSRHVNTLVARYGEGEILSDEAKKLLNPKKGILGGLKEKIISEKPKPLIDVINGLNPNDQKLITDCLVRVRDEMLDAHQKLNINEATMVWINQKELNNWQRDRRSKINEFERAWQLPQPPIPPRPGVA